MQGKQQLDLMRGLKVLQRDASIHLGELMQK